MLPTGMVDRLAELKSRADAGEIWNRLVRAGRRQILRADDSYRKIAHSATADSAIPERTGHQVSFECIADTFADFAAH